AGTDLASLDERVQDGTANAGLAARAQVLSTAASAVEVSDLVGNGEPLVVLDVPIAGPLEAAVVAALLARAGSSLVTLPAEDDETRKSLHGLGVSIDPVEDDRPAVGLSRLGRFLFSSDTPPETARDSSVQLFSAPGEGRECLEIARRILACAAEGVRF